MNRGKNFVVPILVGRNTFITFLRFRKEGRDVLRFRISFAEIFDARSVSIFYFIELQFNKRIIARSNNSNKKS